MFRVALATLALTLSAPALACAGGKCTSGHCQMKSVDETTTAMAAVDAASGDKITLAVTGMTCGSCGDKVTKALTELEGVHAAAVDHAGGVAKIAYDAEKVDADKLVAAIVAIGFEASTPEA